MGPFPSQISWKQPLPLTDFSPKQSTLFEVIIQNYCKIYKCGPSGTVSSTADLYRLEWFVSCSIKLQLLWQILHLCPSTFSQN